MFRWHSHHNYEERRTCFESFHIIGLHGIITEPLGFIWYILLFKINSINSNQSYRERETSIWCEPLEVYSINVKEHFLLRTYKEIFKCQKVHLLQIFNFACILYRLFELGTFFWLAVRIRSSVPNSNKKVIFKYLISQLF